jgi:mitochondrial-processing peptidase subunit alpha
VTTLPNGIRVATEELPSPFASVGVFIAAGSRFENAYLSGASHIMDRIAFKSTKKNTVDQFINKMDMLGGMISCTSSRESMMYQAATFNSTVEETVALLSEAIRDPLVTPEEVEVQLTAAEYEINEIWTKPELILPELVSEVAWQNNTLGMPLLCPKDRLPYINRDVLDAYRQTLYRPERMVVAFSGISHQEAVRLSEKWFGDMPAGQPASLPLLQELSTSASSTSTTGSFFSKIPGVKNLSTTASRAASVLNDAFAGDLSINLDEKAKYTGGFITLPGTPSIHPNFPDLSHMYVAFEAASLSDSDIYAVALLQSYLGGGSSFSAGGPGKGMFSRLYVNVLNNFGWVDNCHAFNSAYADSGLLGISASVHPDRTLQMLDVICKEFHELRSIAHKRNHKQAEFQRAKNILKSFLLMNLESQLTSMEDLGRQILLHGRKVGRREMMEKLDATTLEDVQRVAEKIMDGRVGSQGGSSGIPTVVIQEAPGFNSFQNGWEDVKERISKWGLGRR